MWLRNWNKYWLIVIRILKKEYTTSCKAMAKSAVLVSEIKWKYEKYIYQNFARLYNATIKQWWKFISDVFVIKHNVGYDSREDLWSIATARPVVATVKQEDQFHGWLCCDSTQIYAVVDNLQKGVLRKWPSLILLFNQNMVQIALENYCLHPTSIS